MYITRWIKCPVVGDGKEGNPYRPALTPEYRKEVEVITKDKMGKETKKKIIVCPEYYDHKGYRAVYYPSEPPYEYCLVEILIDDKTEFLKEHVTEEYVKKDDFKVACDSIGAKF